MKNITDSNPIWVLVNWKIELDGRSNNLEIEIHLKSIQSLKLF